MIMRDPGINCAEHFPQIFTAAIVKAITIERNPLGTKIRLYDFIMLSYVVLFFIGSVHIEQNLPANDRRHSCRWLHWVMQSLKNHLLFSQIIFSRDEKPAIL